MKRLNNKGMTLVELIVGVVLLAICSLMLMRGFSTSANLVKKASVLKNASTLAANTVELQTVQTSPYDLVEVELDNTLNASGKTTVTIKAKKTKPGTVSKDLSCTVEGMYIVAKETKGTNLKYKEFLPNDFSFEVDAENVD